MELNLSTFLLVLSAGHKDIPTLTLTFQEYGHNAVRMKMPQTNSPHLFLSLPGSPFQEAIVCSLSYCFARVCLHPTKEQSYWTFMIAAPAARSLLLTADVQTSSPAASDRARHEVSHYISLPVLSSSWHSLLHLSLRCQMLLGNGSRHILLVSSRTSTPCQSFPPWFPFVSWQTPCDTASIWFSSEFLVL